jgi:hypothetical protein
LVCTSGELVFSDATIYCGNGHVTQSHLCNDDTCGGPDHVNAAIDLMGCKASCTAAGNYCTHVLWDGSRCLLINGVEFDKCSNSTSEFSVYAASRNGMLNDGDSKVPWGVGNLHPSCDPLHS